MREAAIEAARKKDEEPLKVAIEDDEQVRSPDRHVGGEIPPVRDGLADPEDQQTASELAFDNPELATNDAKEAVALLIVNSFNGDTKKAFEHYDRDEDDGLSQSELASLLKDAGLGKESERLAKNVIGEDELAMDYDATVNYDNFERAFAD